MRSIHVERERRTARVAGAERKGEGKLPSFEYLADGHHVDDAGNLIACTYVDFREPAERFPITTLQKASSKRHAIPGCETIRISKPNRFVDQGEGLAEGGEAHQAANGWVYCASIEPETPEQQAAWRAAMPAGRDALSPIRRPRAFARALGAMVAEQAGPRGRIVLLRSTVEGRSFSAAHRSQTVYHGPVVYLDDPQRHLERASSELELALLLVFAKHAARRAEREYRFVVWAEDEPAEAVVDLAVSPVLVDAMWTLRPQPEDSGFVRAGPEEYSAVEELEGDGPSRARARVETLPAFVGTGNPAVALPPGDDEAPPGGPNEPATTGAAVEALREAVDRADPGCRKDAAAAAWHAEPLLRFLRVTFVGAIARVRVSEDGFIAITAHRPGDNPVEASIAVGPEGTFACTVSAGETHLASTAPDARSFERVLKERLAEVGALGSGR